MQKIKLEPPNRRKSKPIQQNTMELREAHQIELKVHMEKIL